jgi:hypothetical protein
VHLMRRRKGFEVQGSPRAAGHRHRLQVPAQPTRRPRHLLRHAGLGGVPPASVILDRRACAPAVPRPPTIQVGRLHMITAAGVAPDLAPNLYPVLIKVCGFREVLRRVGGGGRRAVGSRRAAIARATSTTASGRTQAPPVAARTTARG